MPTADTRRMEFRLDSTDRPFSASVHQGPAGGWVAEIDLCDGASLAKWFEREEDARAYEHELARWLSHRDGN